MKKSILARIYLSGKKLAEGWKGLVGWWNGKELFQMGIKDFSARGIGKADGPELVTGKQQEFAVWRLLSAQSARNEQLA